MIMAAVIYPGAAERGVSGMVLVHPTSFGMFMEGVLTGLEANVQAGYHVHTGHGGCASADGVDGAGPAHYNTSGSDPWTEIAYTSDASGASAGSASVDTGALSSTLVGKARADADRSRLAPCEQLPTRCPTLELMDRACGRVRR